MGLFDFLKPKKQRTALEALQENPLFKQHKLLYDIMSAQCKDGCDADELPEGHGEFGFELTNPIPTKTTYGSTSYLARLRAPDGAKVVYERLYSCQNADVSPYPIDAYSIDHPDGTSLGVLYISPYHKRNSEKAPKGFTLAKSLYD